MRFENVGSHIELSIYSQNQWLFNAAIFLEPPCSQTILPGSPNALSYGVINRRRFWKYRVIQGWINFFKLKYKKVGVLPIQIVKSNVSSVVPSSERNQFFCLMKGQCSKLYTLLSFTLPYQQYTNLFIFRFVSLHSLHSRLCLLSFLKFSNILGWILKTQFKNISESENLVY